MEQTNGITLEEMEAQAQLGPGIQEFYRDATNPGNDILENSVDKNVAPMFAKPTAQQPMFALPQNGAGGAGSNLPSQDDILGGDVPGEPRPTLRPLGIQYESDAPTPIGRTVDRVNQAIGVAPQAPEGPGSNTASPYDHSATQNRQAYFDRAQQAIEAIGGNTVNQAFRSQDGETFGENKEILGFLKDQGMDVLGTNQQMWSLFEADPLGFIDITKRLGRNATPEAIASQIRR
jgi:hypothetical protein